MALEIKPRRDSIASDLKSIVIKDETGVYDVTTNPTGYGAPNPTRVSLALKLFVKIDKTVGEEYNTVPAYNEFTADEWTIEITEDGIYKYYLIGTAGWDIVTTFALNDVIYYQVTDKFYKSIQAGNLNNVPTDTDWWEETEILEDFLDASNIPSTNVGLFVDNINNYSLDCLAKRSIESICDCGSKKTKESYEELRNLVEGVTYLHGYGDYTKAQEAVELAQAKCDGDDCKSC